jgi:tRNA-guanine family transglycosylase
LEAADSSRLEAEVHERQLRSNEVSQYLHHLMKAGELLGAMLSSAVNFAYYQELTAGARAAIAAGRFAEFHATTKAGWDRGNLPPH